MLTTCSMMPRFFLFTEATKKAYALVMMVMSRDSHLTIRLYYEKLFFFFWENRLVFLCSVVILKISQKTFFFVVVWLADKSLIFLVIPNNSMNKRKNSK